MGNSSLVVVGDAFVDRDVVGRADRLVPDAPVPVVEDCASDSRPGGAALAALLAARDGDAVTLICALGRDATGRWCSAALTRAGVHLVDCSSTDATACKMRVRAGAQLVARVDRGGPRTAPASLPPAAAAALEAADAVLVSDYGRGMTAHDGIRALLARAAARRPLVWDPHPKGSPAVPGARLLTPNASEAATLGGGVANASGLAGHVANARSLAASWDAIAAVVTLGPRGAVLVDGEGPPLAVPAPRVGSGDPCGAGDRFAVRVTQCLSRGALTSEAVHAAVEAASEFVAGGGVEALRPDDSSPKRLRASSESRTSPTELTRRLAEVRRRGGVVVAAGGCFDILHVGHIAMLQAARALGDFLVVCINSDASVRRLKGDGRPIVGERDRAALVGALADVDSVVVFDEPTPAAALEQLRPDIFVKGADYAHRTLPEAEVLERWGGQVVVVPYVSGRSTSTLIAEMTRDG